MRPLMHTKLSKSWLSPMIVVVAATILLTSCKHGNSTSGAGRSPAVGQGGDRRIEETNTTVSTRPGSSTAPTTTTTTTLPPTAQSECHKAPDEFVCKVELAIVAQTNELRGTRTPLRHAKRMGYSSRLWSESMAKRGFIGHAGFPLVRERDYAAEFGSARDVSMGAENVAMSGASSSADPEAVARIFTRMWWTSAGHRANMLGRHETIGVGVARTSRGTWYATQIFGRGGE
jgi:uncharacterized protein YkwD